MEGNMQLSGQLSDWSVADLLQIMQVTSKTGSLDIEGERSGRVMFNVGEIVGAELTGSKGGYRGYERSAIADVLYVLTKIEEGSFKIGKEDGPVGEEALAVKTVMSDLDELEKIEEEVSKSGLFEAAGIRLVHDLERPITLEPDDWLTVVSLVQPFSFHYLETKMGRGGAVRILHTLHRLGLADVGDEEENPEWLSEIPGAEIDDDTDEPTWSELDDDVEDEETLAEPVDPEPAVEEPQPVPIARERDPVAMKGLSAPANTTLTDGVYDEIRRLRSKAADA